MTVSHSDVTSLQVVVFSLNGEHYALPIADVSEIIRYTRPRSISSDLPWIRGVISLRGKIIPVFELASRLGFGASADEPDNIIVIEAGARHVGVMVDAVDEVLTVTGEQIERPPVGTGGGNDAIVKLGDRLIVLLDVPQLLADCQPETEIAAELAETELTAT
jgi:purine-binding chemotaxis protein CheW